MLKPAPPHATMPDSVGPPSDERAYAEEVRQSNKEALEALFRAFYAELVAFAEAQVRERAAAEDLVGEIFLEIWQRGQSWQPEGALRPYLYGAVRKKCLMHFRQRYARTRHHAEADVEGHAGKGGPEQAFRSRELERAGVEAVEALPERRRLIFILSRYQGLSYAEIAAVLGLSVHTVRNQMAHALRFLRTRLAPYLFTLFLGLTL